MALFADRVRLIATENAFAIGPCIQEIEARGHRVIRCNIGEPDFELPDHVREEVKRQLDAGNTHYSDPQGITFGSRSPPPSRISRRPCGGSASPRPIAAVSEIFSAKDGIVIDTQDE